MDLYNDLLEKTYLEQEKLKKSCEAEFAALPDGRLYGVFSKKDEYMQFYCELHVNGKRKRVGLNRKPSVIGALARKALVKRQIKLLDKNLSLLDKVRGQLNDVDVSSIIKQMPKYLQILPKEYFFREGKGKEVIISGGDNSLEEISPEIFRQFSFEKRLEYHRQWACIDFERSTFEFPEDEITTTSGVRVRSKGELSIAQKLEELGIPYRYEQIIHLGGRNFAPDFTVETADLSPLYIEFCGMMGDSEYLRKFQEKRRAYERAGLTEWDNVVYLYAKGNELNMQRVDGMIRLLVLSRL